MTGGSRDDVPNPTRPLADPLRSDAELVALARQDRAAFGPLYDRYVDRIYRYCFRRLRDREAAEDATSQTFLRALSAVDSHRATDGSFAAWLFTIAERVVIDTARRRRPTAPLGGLPERAANDPSPEDIALAADEADRLRTLLAHLPPDQRRAIELRLADLTGPEVARVMGRPPGAVKQLQFRAITTLRRLLHVPTLTKLDERKDRP